MVVVLVGGLVWGVRLEERHNALKDKVTSECLRSISIDAAQDENQRVTGVTVAEISRDIAHILEKINHNATTTDEILKELRNR